MGVLIESLALKFHGSTDLRTLPRHAACSAATRPSPPSRWTSPSSCSATSTCRLALYLVGSVALSILALYAGMWLTRWLLT